MMSQNEMDQDYQELPSSHVVQELTLDQHGMFIRASNSSDQSLVTNDGLDKVDDRNGSAWMHVTSGLTQNPRGSNEIVHAGHNGVCLEKEMEAFEEYSSNTDLDGKNGSKNLVELLKLSPAVTYTGQCCGELSIKFVSDNVKFVLGYHAKEFINNPRFWIDKIHPEDTSRVKACLSLLSTGYYTYEYRFLHKDGKYRWIRDELRLIPNESGGPTEVVGFWFDVSEHKQAEEKLHKAVHQLKELESIVNKSPAVVFLWRNAERFPVEFVSENIRQLGYTPEEFLEERIDFAEIIHPEDVERVLSEILTHGPQEPLERRQEYRIVTKSGEERWVAVSHCIRCDADNRVTHYEGIILDITQKKTSRNPAPASRNAFSRLG